jgi:RHS repeat-associated protein
LISGSQLAKIDFPIDVDERVASTSGTDTRRFLYAPDGRVLGGAVGVAEQQYGSTAADVRAEFIWLSPEVGDSGKFGGDDGLGGYMPLAVATPTATAGTTQLSWVHASHMGVPIRYSDASGATLAAPTGYSVPGFPGQSQTTADLYYNKYRDYDASTGRYVQADPIGLAGGASPYSYAMNNPMRYTDPEGLKCLNLFPDSQPGMRAAAAIQCALVDPDNSPDVTHIFGHGVPQKICPAGQNCQSGFDIIVVLLWRSIWR